MRPRSLLACACAFAISLTGARAGAEAPTDSAKAEALFREATRLLAKNRYEESCAKFAESKRLEPGIGVTLYLGDCYEHLGRTASAWAEFSAAEDAAGLAHDPRSRVAHERAARLETRLSRVILRVAGNTDGLEVKQDGVVVGPVQFGVPLPVDPGDHHFDATAPHHRAWAETLHVAEGPSTATIDVPPLAPEAPPMAPAVAEPAPMPFPRPGPLPASSAPPAGSSPQRALGWVTLGVGVAAAGAGALFGLAARSKLESSNANGQCNASDHCTAEGLATRSDGMRDATESTIAFGIAAGALVGGALLLLTAPRADAVAAAPVELGGAFGPGGARVTAAVRF